MFELYIVARIGAPILTGWGVILGVWGTLMICKPYYPFSTLGFVRRVLGVFWALRHGMEEALKLVEITSRLGAVNGEDRPKSLIGVYFVFFGFVLQAIGAVLWCLDAVLATRFSTR